MRPYWETQRIAPGLKKSAGDNIWWDVLALGAGLFLAAYNEWLVKDLVWGLWLSSWVVGFVVILVDITYSMRERLMPLRSGVILLVFFSVHFSLAHLLYAFFLDGFFPITPTDEHFGFKAIGEVFSCYWILILVLAGSERRLLNEGFEKKRVSVTTRIADAAFGAFKPYRNVFRMHILILAFAFLNFIELESFPIYATVYLVNFFPWKRILFN